MPIIGMMSIKSLEKKSTESLGKMSIVGMMPMKCIENKKVLPIVSKLPITCVKNHDNVCLKKPGTVIHNGALSQIFLNKKTCH